MVNMMKKIWFFFLLSASFLPAQVQIGKGVQIGYAVGNGSSGSSGTVQSADGTGGFQPATAANIASTVQSASGCTTAGYVWSPQSGTCIAAGNGSTGSQGTIQAAGATAGTFQAATQSAGLSLLGVPASASLLGTDASSHFISVSGVNPYCAGVLCASQTNYNFTPNTAPALTVAMSSSDTTMTVGSTSGFPTVGCGLILGNQPTTHPEVVCWSGSTSTAFSGLTRGIYGTTAGNHQVAETMIGISQSVALTINSVPFSVFYNNGIQSYGGTGYQGSGPISFISPAQFASNVLVGGTLTTYTFHMYNGISGTQGSWNASTGQLLSSWINGTYEVAVGTLSNLRTIQSAVTAACTATSGRVLIPANSSPSDTIGAVTGGCTAVGIEDQRVTPNQFYTWNGSVYSLAASSDGNVISPKANYGAYGDAQQVNDCTVTTTTTLTCATSHFVASDVGKVLAIPYAGSTDGTHVNQQTFVTSIAAYVSGTQVTLAAAPVFAVAGPRTVTDFACTNGQFVCTSATANFTQSDVGKKIVVPGTGVPISSGVGGDEPAEIAVVSSATSATLTRYSFFSLSSLTVTIPGATVIWGHDDTTALQSSIDAGCSSHRQVMLDVANYLTTASLVPCDNMSVTGRDSSSIITGVGAGFATFYRIGNAAAPVVNTSYTHFTIVGEGVRSQSYTTANKAIYTTYNVGLTIDNMNIQGTGATSIGVDTNINARITNNRVDYGGDMAAQTASYAGSACIGLGTGIVQTEDQIVDNNIVTNCGAHGIFVESQASTRWSTGIIISNNYVGWSGNVPTGDGIGDHANRGTTIEANFVEHSGSGITVTKGFPTTFYGFDYNITGNTLLANTVGIAITAAIGGGRITNNLIAGFDPNVLSPPMGINGITVTPQTATGATSIEIGSNLIHDLNGRCVYLAASGSTYLNNMQVTGNTIYNCGSGSTHRGGLENTAYVKNLNWQRNNVFDTRGASSTTSYGLINTGTIDRLYISSNDTSQTLNGSINNTGTITSTYAPTITGTATVSNPATTVTIPYSTVTTAPRCTVTPSSTPAVTAALGGYSCTTTTTGATITVGTTPTTTATFDYTLNFEQYP
jgi:hypothetical protein